MQQTIKNLVWLRADLRSTDNPALLAACAHHAAAVACVYAITPQQWQAHDVAGVRVDFELRTLHALQKFLATLNIPLLIVHAPTFNALPAELCALVKKHGIHAVYANHQYEINEQQRDQKTAAALEKLGVHFYRTHDQCIVPPATLCKEDGGFYSVFTPFKRKWLARIHSTNCLPQDAPSARSTTFTHSDDIPTAVAGFSSKVAASIANTWWPAGEAAALQRLAVFAEHAVGSYHTQRDFPAADGVSKLSPYLAVGAISARQCLHAARLHAAHASGALAEKGSEQWISELCWRDFYKHVLCAWPRVCMHRPFKTNTDAIPWRHHEPDFQRWCEGRTGFPLVDAAMRQLQATGWMHNRLRMVVAMFLTKDLLIDWRWGERFFMQHLIDGDLSANNGGWQWSASTGNDAVPYFRIFNPTEQSKRFDPSGHFIREYVPELRGVASKNIHAPQSADYPEPMVDHKAARERTLAHFKALGALPHAI